MDQSMTPEQAAQLIDMIKYAREVEQRKAQHAQAAFDGVREFVEALVRGESPALRADRDDAREVLNEFVSSADAAVKAQLGKSSTSHELLNTRSAAGIVAECWRDVLEPWHYYFSDAEMAWMRRRRCRHRSGKVTCTYFLDEFGLHQRVGGAEVHAGQLLHLLFMANRPNIRIRIVPAAHDAHAGLAGPFTQLTFTKYEPLVWCRPRTPASSTRRRTQSTVTRPLFARLRSKACMKPCSPLVTRQLRRRRVRPSRSSRLLR
jgi:hypothetical protein